MNTTRTLGAAAALAAALLAGCATTPIEPYVPPAAGQPAAEVQLQLMQPSRNRSAALYVRGAAKCSPPGAAALLNRTMEDPPRLVAGSWENRTGAVVRLPAGEPLPLRFRYTGPGEERIADVVVQLQPGARYVFDHEIPGYRFSLVDSATGQPVPLLPPRLLHMGLQCPG